MSDNDVLAALFGGAGYGGVNRGADADLAAFDRTITLNDPWRLAAAPVFGAKFDTSTWNPMQTLGVTAGQAFLGTMLNALGQRSEAQQLEKVAQVLPQLYSNPSSVSVPEGVDPEAFGTLKLSALKNTADSQAKLFADVFSKNPALAVTTMPELAAKFKIKVPDAPKPEPLVEGLEDTGPSLVNGKETTAKKVLKYAQAFMDGGMPATQAAVTARQQVEGEIKANTKTFDEAKAAREYGQKLLDLSNTANAGLTQAGTTGNFEALREMWDYVASTFDDKAQERRTGRQVLTSIAPEIVKMSRSPGAVSDFETKLYLGAGPGVNQTPETNAILAQKMADLGKLQLDYADFLDAYREQNAGSTLGAAKKWSEYRQAFPIFKGDTENIQLNTERPSWQEYFGGQAIPEAASSLGGGPDLNTFIAQAKAVGLSKAEAKAKWESIGGR